MSKKTTPTNSRIIATATQLKDNRIKLEKELNKVLSNHYKKSKFGHHQKMNIYTDGWKIKVKSVTDISGIKIKSGRNR